MVPLLLLAVVAAAAVALLETVTRRTAVGFVLVAGNVVVDTVLVGTELRAQVGPFAVYPNDVVFGLLGVAAAARLLRSRRIHPLQLLVILFLVLSVWSAVRGVPLFGPGTALNEARKNLLYSCAVLYFSTDGGLAERGDPILRWWLGLSSYLLAAAGIRWLLFFAGMTSFLAEGDTLRVLDSFDTVVLLTGFLLAAGPLIQPPERGTAGLRRPSTGHELFVVGSCLAVILLQHRTLWIALILGMALLTVRNPRMTGRLLVGTLIGAVVVGGLAIAVFGQGVERVVTDELSSSATDVDTFDWRVAGWTSLLERATPDDPQEVLFGQPFGGGFDRYVEGQRITVSPHNFFLESYLRVGLVGLAAFVALHAILAVRLYRSRGRRGGLREDALGVVVLVLALYYVTSHPSPEHGVITGFAVAVATTQRHRRPRPPVGPTADERRLEVAR